MPKPTAARLDALLHALTYTNLSASPPLTSHEFQIELQDSGGRTDYTYSMVAVLPASAISVPKNTSYLGTEQAEMFFADPYATGISIAAGGGTDTLVLSPYTGRDFSDERYDLQP